MACMKQFLLQAKEVDQEDPHQRLQLLRITDPVKCQQNVISLTLEKIKQLKYGTSFIIYKKTCKLKHIKQKKKPVIFLIWYRHFLV